MKIKKLSSLKATLVKNGINVLGWKSNRKIIVIESDDWGTIRMSSKSAFDDLLKKGYPVDKCGYNKNDSIESNEDLEALKRTLLSIRNKEGMTPKITMNTIMTNPNFDKIKEVNYSEYYFEPFTETLKRYEGRDSVMELYREGIDLKIFKPQLHGLAHVNVSRWLNDLQRGDKALLDAFEWGMFSVHTNKSSEYPMEYMDALSPESIKENERFKSELKEAAVLFNEIFGFGSKTFIAPCFIWDSSIHSTLSEIGIVGVQGQFYQNQPTYSIPKYRTLYHYLGQELNSSLYYVMRNVTFEPAIYPEVDSIKNALREIDIAFKWKKPAVISTHRVNYIGAVHHQNRENGLKQLKILLEEVIRRHPEVEFLSSDELVNNFNIKVK